MVLIDKPNGTSVVVYRFVLIITGHHAIVSLLKIKILNQLGFSQITSYTNSTPGDCIIISEPVKEDCLIL